MVTTKTENALVSLVSAALTADGGFTGTTVYAGKNGEDKTGPCVICTADGEGEEDPPASGNFWVTCSVSVKHSAVPDEDGTATQTAASQKTESEDLTQTAFNSVAVDDLAQQLTAAVSDYYAYPGSVTLGPQTSQQDEGGVWIDSLAIRLMCCDSALS